MVQELAIDQLYEVERKDMRGVFHTVRKMTSCEIEMDEGEVFYCDDETGHIFEEKELTFK